MKNDDKKKRPVTAPYGRKTGMKRCLKFSSGAPRAAPEAVPRVLGSFAPEVSHYPSDPQTYSTDKMSSSSNSSTDVGIEELTQQIDELTQLKLKKMKVTIS